MKSFVILIGLVVAFPAFSGVVKLPPELMYDGRVISPSCMHGDLRKLDLRECSNASAQPAVLKDGWYEASGASYKYIGKTKDQVILWSNGGEEFLDTSIAAFRRDGAFLKRMRHYDIGNYSLRNEGDVSAIDDVYLRGDDVFIEAQVEYAKLYGLAGLKQPKMNRCGRRIATAVFKNESFAYLIPYKGDESQDFSERPSEQFFKEHLTSKWNKQQLRAFLKKNPSDCARSNADPVPSASPSSASVSQP